MCLDANISLASESTFNCQQKLLFSWKKQNGFKRMQSRNINTNNDFIGHSMAFYEYEGHRFDLFSSYTTTNEQQLNSEYYLSNEKYSNWTEREL